MEHDNARRGVKTLIALALGLLAAPTVLVSAAAASAPSAAVVKPPDGAGHPTAGSGIGTKAALDNPRCNTDKEFGVYGRFDTFAVGGNGSGPLCVKAWKAGADNGGATSRGVTADAIKVIAVVPNQQQIATAGASAGAAPMNRAGGAGTYSDAVHDWLVAQMQYYETWGRDLDVKFFTSTGDDETAQRADAVAIRNENPFAVLNFVTTGLDTLEADVANGKTLVYGYAASSSEALQQAPFRWGASDIEAAAVNSAEVIGKQLVGTPAEFAGDDATKSQTRKFGVVYMEDVVDINGFENGLKEYKGTVTTEASYPATGDTFGNPTVAQQQAPTIVSKMKSDGVTTVVLFTDVAMNKALMEQATAQEWFPEWFLTGALFYDIAALARQYPPDQSRHAFGIVALPPWLQPDQDPAVRAVSTAQAPLDWYWGAGVGTYSPRVIAQIGWLLAGIHAAGPDLTPKTFKQGLFSIPANGGAATGNPVLPMSGYGKTTGLPYESYLNSNLDFAAAWMDPDTEGPSAGTGTVAKHVTWYLDGGKRYKSGGWPKQAFAWFDKSSSIIEYTTRPASAPTPVAAAPCTGCPSQGGGSVVVGTPSPDGFVAEARAPGTV